MHQLRNVSDQFELSSPAALVGCWYVPCQPGCQVPETVSGAGLGGRISRRSTYVSAVVGSCPWTILKGYEESIYTRSAELHQDIHDIWMQGELLSLKGQIITQRSDTRH